MRSRYGISLWMTLVFLTGCGVSDCGLAGDSFELVYRGHSQIERQGAVVRDGVHVGFIEKVTGGRDEQRVTLRVQDVSIFTKNDRFFPWRHEGKVGVKVLPGIGEPLTPGDRVYAGRPARAVDPDGAISRPNEAWGGREAPGREPGRGPARAGEGRANLWGQGRALEMLDNARITENELPAVPSELVRRIRELTRQADNARPDEAVELITEELDRLEHEWDELNEQADKEGDREASRQLRMLEKKTTSILHRMRLQASQAARGN